MLYRPSYLKALVANEIGGGGVVREGLFRIERGRNSQGGGSLNLCNHMLNGPFHRMSMPSSIWAISLSWSISVASFDPSYFY